MGSYAQLRVGDLEVAHFKSEIESWIALIFTAGDWRSRPASQDELDNYDAFWKKADAVSRDPSIVAQQDWADLRAVIDCVRFAFVDT